MTGESSKQLDHATARIITELAAALLPQLKDAISAEVTRAIQSLPISVDREVEEVLSSLKRLQAFSEDMTTAFSSAQSSASQVSSELLPLLRMCETLNAATVRLEQFASNDGAEENAIQMTNELLRSLEANLSDWEGILKANGRAQTRELSEFSTEVSEQVSWVTSGMSQMVGEILDKTLSSRIEEWSQAANENTRVLEARLARLEKIGRMILAGGFALVASLAVIATVLYLKII